MKHINLLVIGLLVITIGAFAILGHFLENVETGLEIMKKAP
jgi:hypothetical protein